jgi:diadenosine tetraphosphatase ApaH/serine/threonine PP2A family protein phosphatase
MKISLISDVHGNLEALEMVLRDIEKQGAEKIHFLGDAVGYGCNPNECVKLISNHCDIKLLGNHDYAALGLEAVENFNKLAQASIQWTQDILNQKSIEILSDFEMDTDFLDYHLVHASPGMPESWHYILNQNQALEEFEKFTQSACFIGHSHLPAIFIKNGDGDVSKHTKVSFEKYADKKYIINVGSIGQPRDGDPRACYLILDTDSNVMQYKRVEYDITRTQTKMKKAKLPDFLIERLSVGL